MTITSIYQGARSALCATTLLFLSAASAAAQGTDGDKLDAAVRLSAHQLTGRTRVIVEFKNAPDVRVLGRRAGRRLNDRAQVAEVENRDLGTIAADPRVARVMLDRAAFPTLERTRAAVGVTLVREELGLTGKGVGVAIIDSGITSSHDDLYRSNKNLSSRVAHFKDFTVDISAGLPGTTQLPSDEYGHGTHVAGIIAGSGYDSGGRRTGVAPGARLIGLKVLDADGHGYISDVIAAIEYAVAVRSTYNIRVINLSVASGVFESYRLDPLAQAARRAVEAGIVVVAAAGNLGHNDAGQPQYGGITSPGNAPWVLTVGASSHEGTARRGDDSVATFSSRGPTWIDFGAKPDLIAPGVGIESLSEPNSTLYASLPDYLLPGTRKSLFQPYLSLSGTSMAAPVVAGAVALMIEANPALTPNAVKALLQYSAQAGAGEQMLAQGAGLLNARGAVRLARFFKAPQDGVGAMKDMIEGESIAWARHMIWGNYRVTGGVPLPGSNAWSRALTWGALKTRTGTPVAWGANDDSNIVWSTNDDGNIVWSTNDDSNIVWSTSDDANIVWSTGDDSNIVWSTADENNIVWSTATARNVVWGNDCGGYNCSKIVWGARSGAAVWGTADDDFNIVWSTGDDLNIVWSTDADGNIVWSTGGDENIVWSTDVDGNIVWSTGLDSNIVWSTSLDNNIVWSTGVAGQVLWPSPPSIEQQR